MKLPYPCMKSSNLALQEEARLIHQELLISLVYSITFSQLSCESILWSSAILFPVCKIISFFTWLQKASFCLYGFSSCYLFGSAAIATNCLSGAVRSVESAKRVPVIHHNYYHYKRQRIQNHPPTTTTFLVLGKRRFEMYSCISFARQYI